MLQAIKRSQTILFALGAGVALSVLNHFLSITTFLKLVAAASIACLIVWKPVIGVFMVAGLTPLIPTQYLMVLSAVSFLALVLRSLVLRETLIESSMLNLFSIIFAGNVVYGVVISFNRGESVYAALIYLAYIVFFFVMQKCLVSKNLIYTAISLMVTAGFAVSVLGIYQYINGVENAALWIDRNLFGGIETRVYGTLGNPNVLGNYIQILVPLAIFLIIVNKDWLARIYYALATLSMLVSLIFTYSRSSWMGLLLSLAIFTLLAPKKLLPLAAGGIAATPLVLGFFPTILERLKGLGTLVDTSTRFRVAVWSATLGIIKDFWVCGIGMGFENFKRMLFNYAPHDIDSIHSHNTFLQVTVETGIMGLLLFLSLVFLFIRLCLPVYMKSKDDFTKTLAAVLLSSIGGYLLICLFDNTLYDHSLKLVFWTVLSLGAAAGRLSANEMISADGLSSTNDASMDRLSSEDKPSSMDRLAPTDLGGDPQN
jgi:putative inorganic carbon (HCO3(-)) transporter